MSPLGGEFITAFLDQEGWSRFSESVVMSVDLEAIDFDRVIDLIPIRDMPRFIGAAMVVHDFEPSIRPGLSEIVTSIEPESGLFLLEDGDRPVASAICVHDGDLAGLFEVATASGERGRGHGRRVVLSALKWAKLRGARIGWLQVEADNAPAIALYRSLGFRSVYTYHYRKPSA
jgi:ribosomal protein S18 acetylase RimI-like enzyme